jgi:hypothetical protein
MSEYKPPTETLPEFNSEVFRSVGDALTQEDADLRYLRFPIGQGNETIPNLVVQGTSQVGVLAFSDLTTYGKVDYPVNSGETRFYNNTAGGVSTYAAKVDSTGLHTLNNLNTINETGGALTIAGTNSRTAAINIGTGTGGRTITLGSGSSTNQLNGTCVIAPSTVATGDVVKIADDNANGTIRIASGGGVSSSIFIGGGASSTQNITIGTAGMTNAVNVNKLSITSATNKLVMNAITASDDIDLFTNNSAGTINIGTLPAKTGSINIGTGASATAGNLKLGRGGVIDILQATTPTMTFSIPWTPSYDPLAVAPTTTQVGYQRTTTLTTSANIGTGAGNLCGNHTLGAGVWLYELSLKAFATALASDANVEIGISSAAFTFQANRSAMFAYQTITSQMIFKADFVVYSAAATVWYPTCRGVGITQAAPLTNTQFSYIATRIA